LLWPITLGVEIGAPLRYYLGVAVASDAVVCLGFWSVTLFRKSGQSENPWKPTPHIEVRGPLKISRNPMYLQMVLVCIGVAIAMANWWILIITPLGAWMIQELAIKLKRNILRRNSGVPILITRGACVGGYSKAR